MMRRILITGINGFLGRELSKGLDSQHVIGLDRNNADLICNLSKESPSDLVETEIVIHCAGKAHGEPKKNEEKREFFEVNYVGTENLCHALKDQGVLPKCFVLISSVSVYGLEFGVNITEESSLNGTSAYALSKIRAEKFVKNWAESNNINYLILRLPLVVGPSPPGNLGKMIKAIQKKRFLRINNGVARKSMVAASDLPRLILQNTDKSGIYNLTDPVHPSFHELEQVIIGKFNLSEAPNLPIYMAKALAILGEIFPFIPFDMNTLKKMTLDLTFSDDKARNELAWKSSKVTDVLRELDS